MTNRIKALPVAVAAVVALSGCNLLDVNNPNSLTEESVQLPAAANGVANGALRMLSDAASEIWQTTAVASDEMFWTGSRDGWNTLDQGAFDEPRNEFLDAYFPELGTAAWMTNEAVRILEQHVADNPAETKFQLDLARAYFFRGMALLITGETQEDMTFSNKMVDGPPVGPANMYTVLDDAISDLNEAVSRFTTLGQTDLVTAARAVRARAYMSRAIWNELNPSADGLAGAMNFASAVGDAQAVLTAVGTADYVYGFGFSSSASACSMCDWVNNRGENQVNGDLIQLTTAGTGAGGRRTTGDSVNVRLNDPVSGTPDRTVKAMVDRFPTTQYGTLGIATARLMRLIIAEHELSTGGAGDAEFVAQINALRAYDGKSAFASGGAVSDLAILQHERRVHTLFLGLRLPDMFRWGIRALPIADRNNRGGWLSTNSAITSPGELFPITIVEQRANCHLNGLPCGG